MTPPSSPLDQTTLLGKLRWAGVGMATAEVVYLVGWMGVDLGLLEATAFWRPAGGSLNTLQGLMDGMLCAAAAGVAGGLMAGFVGSLLDLATGREVCRQSGQAFARSLVVRNHTR